MDAQVDQEKQEDQVVKDDQENREDQVNQADQDLLDHLAQLVRHLSKVIPNMVTE